MPNYRRLRIPGQSYFFTVNLSMRGSELLINRINDLRAAYSQTISVSPVHCNAMVVLPDHIHAVWTLPPGDDAFSERWRKIKYRFSRAVGAEVGRTAHPTMLSRSKRAKRETGMWQRRFWEHMIRDERDYCAHVEYCWGNPVKHGLVEKAADWPFSSIHRDIRAGRVDPQWVGTETDGEFGERPP